MIEIYSIHKDWKRNTNYRKVGIKQIVIVTSLVKNLNVSWNALDNHKYVVISWAFLFMYKNINKLRNDPNKHNSFFIIITSLQTHSNKNYWWINIELFKLFIYFFEKIGWFTIFKGKSIKAFSK